MTEIMTLTDTKPKPHKMKSAEYDEFTWDDVDLTQFPSYQLYTIGRQIGDGTTSDVFYAEHPVHNQVAIKRFHPQYMFNMATESSHLDKITPHENILHFIESWTGEDYREHGTIYSFASMEIMDGNLLDIIGKMSQDEIEDCIFQLISAVKHIHSCGIAHLDLKPENIAFKKNANGTKIYKIIDFGSSEDIEFMLIPRFQQSLNNRVFEITTYPYRSMEAIILDGKQVHNEKADIWAIGCIIYELMFEDQLFLTSRNNSIEKNMSIMQNAFSRISEMVDIYESNKINSSAYFLFTLIRECLEMNVEKRVSATELMEKYVSLKV